MERFKQIIFKNEETENVKIFGNVKISQIRFFAKEVLSVRHEFLFDHAKMKTETQIVYEDDITQVGIIRFYLKDEEMPVEKVHFCGLK
jgi:hypothetical protein